MINQTDFTPDRKKTKPIPVYVGSHIVGKVCKGVFRKSVIGSRHFLLKPKAIAFDVDSLSQAERAGADCVEVFDKETRTTFRASIAHIRGDGFLLDRGYGKQIALTMEGWIKTTMGQPIQRRFF